MKLAALESKELQLCLRLVSQVSQGGQVAIIFMGKEKIHIPEFKTALQDFIQWLETLSYSKATVITRQRNVYDFLVFLQKNKITSIEQITNEMLNNYISYQKRRTNKIYKAGLKTSSINVSIASINRLFEYLQKSGKYNTGNILKLPYLENNQSTKNILTTEETRQIISSSYTIKQHKLNPLPIGQRDRAMLAVYYGCGLRKSEGIDLKTNDIFFERKLLHVKKGKGNKERYVPVTAVNLNYLKDYISGCRKQLLSKKPEETTGYLFVNQYGQKCGGQSLSNRLKKLAENTENQNIISKQPTLHTLRHSIATHLLQQGMEIEMIRKFLGHQSLESTQIYTHLVNEL